MIPKNRCAAGATLLIRGGAVPRTTPGYLGVWMVLAECSCRWCVGLGDRQEATGGGVLKRRGSGSDGTYQCILRNLHWGNGRSPPWCECLSYKKNMSAFAILASDKTCSVTVRCFLRNLSYATWKRGCRTGGSGLRSVDVSGAAQGSWPRRMASGVGGCGQLLAASSGKRWCAGVGTSNVHTEKV